jgi:hypothetical protein
MGTRHLYWILTGISYASTISKHTTRDVDPHHFADPDPNFHFNADPDPDPAPHQIDANLRPLVYRLS